MTLNERARKLKEISPLMQGRTKLETRNALNRDLTIIAVDFVKTGDRVEYAIVVFAEEPDKFMFSGMVLTSLLVDLVASLAAEDKFIEDELANQGLRIRMTSKASRRDPMRGYTDVEVL